MEEVMVKALPKKVADAFATVTITGELPTTYPSRNPRFIYFLRPGHGVWEEPVRDEAYDKFAFDEFESYIEKTGRRDSAGVYYQLRREYR
jgi:hypothetical protein